MTSLGIEEIKLLSNSELAEKKRVQATIEKAIATVQTAAEPDAFELLSFPANTFEIARLLTDIYEICNTKPNAPVQERIQQLPSIVQTVERNMKDNHTDFGDEIVKLSSPDGIIPYTFTRDGVDIYLEITENNDSGLASVAIGVLKTQPKPTLSKGMIDYLKIHNPLARD